MSDISNEQALAICDELRIANRGKWFTYQAWWCWGCITFTKGEPDQRCFAGKPGNRGCDQVNERFESVNPN